MYILIAGGGLVGKGLAKSLHEAKHDVVIIDSCEDVCKDLYTSTGAVTITGSATRCCHRGPVASSIISIHDELSARIGARKKPVH